MINLGKEAVLKYHRGILASLLVGAISLISFGNIVNFYVNDETNTSEWKIENGSQFENDYVFNIEGKNLLINYNGLLNNALKIPEMNEVVKLRNNHLTIIYDDVSDAVLDKKAEEMKRVSEAFKCVNVDFLYLILPYQVSKYDNQLPMGYEEYTNDDLDYFKNRLDDLNVTYLDLREQFYNEGIDQYDLWYKTDHHWTMRGGLAAFNEVNKFVSSRYGIEVHEVVLSDECYEKIVYPKWHVGSYGQRTGTEFAGVDDFELYIPKFETDIINSNGVEGKLEELVYSYEALENRNYETRRTYDSVLDRARGQYTNNNARNEFKVLWSGDSMLKAVMPFSIMAYRNTYYMHADDVTYEFLETNKPDIVIMCISPSDYYSDEYTDSFFFFKGI